MSSDLQENSSRKFLKAPPPWRLAPPPCARASRLRGGLPAAVGLSGRGSPPPPPLGRPPAPRAVAPVRCSAPGGGGSFARFGSALRRRPGLSRPPAGRARSGGCLKWRAVSLRSCGLCPPARSLWSRARAVAASPQCRIGRGKEQLERKTDARSIDSGSEGQRDCPALRATMPCQSTAATIENLHGMDDESLQQSRNCCKFFL